MQDPPLTDTPPTPLPVPYGADPGAEIEALADRYLRASGFMMQLVTLVGGQLEGAVTRLPAKVRLRIETAARSALATAYGAAAGSRSARPSGDRAHRAAVTAFGALGGIGGLPSALAELPLTTTAILRSIQEIAAEHGEDPTAEETRAACLQVLGTGGPLAEDDGTDFAFLGARLTLTGPALNRLIAQIAPRFAAVLGQKLGAKAVPVIGVLAGAGTNLAFIRFYQEMAHVHFGLRRLARHGALHAPATFQARVVALKALRKA